MHVTQSNPEARGKAFCRSLCESSGREAATKIEGLTESDMGTIMSQGYMCCPHGLGETERLPPLLRQWKGMGSDLASGAAARQVFFKEGNQLETEGQGTGRAASPGRRVAGTQP